MKTRLAMWTCAVMTVAAVLRPEGAHAQAPYPLPPDPGVPPVLGPEEPDYGGTSAARLLVTPKETEVFVDGRYAGKVGEFHGFWQRLDLPAGGHELTLYLEGYRTIREKLHFEPGATYKIKWSMERLGAGESSGLRPEPPRKAAPATERESVPPSATTSGHPRDASGFGTLAIRVQPSDATVLIDGERWEGPAPGNRLTVQVSEGTHRVEVGKHGYQTFSSSVRVRDGQVTRLNVSLSSLEAQ